MDLYQIDSCVPPHPTTGPNIEWGSICQHRHWLEKLPCTAFPCTPQKSDLNGRNSCWQSNVHRWQFWWSLLLLSYLVFLWLSWKRKRLFKSHYDLKGGWLFAFTFAPQAILFNISDVVVQNSTIFICYAFLPSAGINYQMNVENCTFWNCFSKWSLKLLSSHSVHPKPTEEILKTIVSDQTTWFLTINPDPISESDHLVSKMYLLQNTRRKWGTVETKHVRGNWGTRNMPAFIHNTSEMQVLMLNGNTGK